jgi:nucleoside phosphorylase
VSAGPTNTHQEAPVHCAVILTALSLERKAVLEHLDLTGRRNEEDKYGTIYSCGTFTSGDVRWKVAIAECGPGNDHVTSIANYAIMHFDPQIVLFVGVAGSLKEDVLLGDVVASTKVYNIHSGKAEKVFRPRPTVENTSYRLEQLARAIASADEWLKRIRQRHEDRAEDPKVHVGPIAAGDQVVADERSPTHRIIKQSYGDALAVEMEGYGTLAATRIPQIDAIVIRSISDKVVDKKECDKKGWQPIAAHFASVFAFELLANYRVKPGNFAAPTQPEKPPASGSGGLHRQQKPPSLKKDPGRRSGYSPMSKW